MHNGASDGHSKLDGENLNTPESATGTKSSFLASFAELGRLFAELGLLELLTLRSYRKQSYFVQLDEASPHPGRFVKKIALECH